MSKWRLETPFLYELAIGRDAKLMAPRIPTKWVPQDFRLLVFPGFMAGI
jgi:hypothetical protein